LPPGGHTLQVVPAGEPPTAVFVEQELDAAPAAAYIFVVLGRLNAIEAKIFDVNLDEIEPGNARARVINASPDAAHNIPASSVEDLRGTSGIEVVEAVVRRDNRRALDERIRALRP